MNYKQCCIDCGFHFFDEDECPNCWAKEEMERYHAEWDRQLQLLSLITGIQCNEDFWGRWHSKNSTYKNYFRSVCQQVSPWIYDWYESIENERLWEQWREPEQMNLFDEPLPF